MSEKKAGRLDVRWIVTVALVAIAAAALGFLVGNWLGG